MIKNYLIGIIIILLIIWLNSCSKTKKNNKYINFFNKIKIPLLILSVGIYFYDEFDLNINSMMSINKSPINNLYTEPATF